MEAQHAALKAQIAEYDQFLDEKVEKFSNISSISSELEEEKKDDSLLAGKTFRDLMFSKVFVCFKEFLVFIQERCQGEKKRRSLNFFCIIWHKKTRRKKLINQLSEISS